MHVVICFSAKAAQEWNGIGSMLVNKKCLVMRPLQSNAPFRLEDIQDRASEQVCDKISQAFSDTSSLHHHPLLLVKKEGRWGVWSERVWVKAVSGDDCHARLAWYHQVQHFTWEKLQEEAYIHSRKIKKIEMKIFQASKIFLKSTKGSCVLLTTKCERFRL